MTVCQEGSIKCEENKCTKFVKRNAWKGPSTKAS
nr:MAG TPA: hypothetical protein [Caudoviricetes sp.]